MASNRKSRQQPEQAARASGGIAIAGNIQAGRDVIIGNQYNDLRQQVVCIQTPSEFVTQLQALQAEIAALRAQAELTPQQVQQIEVAEEGVQRAIKEAQQPEPLAARITATLSSAKAVLEAISGSVRAAIGLGTVLASLIQIAEKVF